MCSCGLCTRCFLTAYRWGKIRGNLWVYAGKFPRSEYGPPEGLPDARIDFLREQWALHKDEVMAFHIAKWRDGSDLFLLPMEREEVSSFLVAFLVDLNGSASKIFVKSSRDCFAVRSAGLASVDRAPYGLLSHRCLPDRSWLTVTVARQPFSGFSGLELRAAAVQPRSLPDFREPAHIA
jgi:hypothetical protein